MNRNTTLILVGAFAVLLLYVLLVQRPAEEAKANATPTAGIITTGNVLGAVTADKVLSVRIADRAAGVSVAFGRSDPSAAWTVSEPEVRPADQISAATNAGTLTNLTYNTTLTPTQELSAFGVLSPTYVIDVKTADGSALKVNIGDKTPTGDAYYVAVDGAATVMIVSSFSLDPILGWVQSPPYLQPTATPTAEITSTVAAPVPITETVPAPAATPSP